MTLANADLQHTVFSSMDMIDEYFCPIEDGKIPSLEARATELARLWNSFSPREITASVSEIIALDQRHVVRVRCPYFSCGDRANLSPRSVCMGHL